MPDHSLHSARRCVLAALISALALSACSASNTVDPELQPEVFDLLRRIEERSAYEQRETATLTATSLESKQALLMNNLQRNLATWSQMAAQGDAKLVEIERHLTVEVVSQFDLVFDAFLTWPRHRRLVAAWALGFSRVPPNDMDIESPHRRAIPELAKALETADDQLARNILLAFWKLEDPQIPLLTVLEMAAHHHDSHVRTNATLALTTCLTPSSARRAVNSVLVALDDDAPQVRQHAAEVARIHPDRAYTARIATMVLDEPYPGVQCAMASALGYSGQKNITPVLVELMRDGTMDVPSYAHHALVMLYGEDKGQQAVHWE